MAISVPVTLDEIRPDVGPLRMNSMGSYNIKYFEAQVLPNYLRASIGSCHDICKFGKRRDFTMQTSTNMPGKLPVSTNKSRDPDKNNNLRKKNSSFCSSGSPSTARKPASQVRTKEIQPGAKKLAAIAKNPHKLKMKPIEKEGASKSGWKFGTNASKQTQPPKGSKKFTSMPKTGSFSQKPQVRKVLRRASPLQNKDTTTKADIETASVDHIPEKILFITELNSEKQSVGFTPEENIGNDSLQCQKQIEASLPQNTEDESYVDKEIDLILFSPRQSSSKESIDSQSHEWDNSTESSSSAAEADRSSNMRTRDEYYKSDGNENEMNNVVLRHQNVEQKRSTEGLYNDVIEETAKKLVMARKSKVKALVDAFETVISLQDLSLQEQLKCGQLPKFPLIVD